MKYPRIQATELLVNQELGLQHKFTRAKESCFTLL